MEPNVIAWTILLLPLAVSAVILVFLRKAAGVSALLATGSALLTLILSLMLTHPTLFGQKDFYGADTEHQAAAETAETAGKDHHAGENQPNGLKCYPWIDLGKEFKVEMGVKFDGLSQGMMLIVTFIGFLVHLFSLGYMKDDEGKARYFGGLALFMFSMTGIVMAVNFVMMFIFWELVGVSSYILISHWYQKPSAADAAKKAFLTNRIGDFGFMIGILIIWKLLGTFDFTGLKEAVANGIPGDQTTLLNLAVFCIFCGAIGKSAQAPLHVWLPDAMEGPTPVSALIHAATMVAAGVFMMARISFLVASAEVAAAIIAWVGIITALLAALIALQQDDIKKILAYSTLSQLGYMIMAQGLGESGSAHGMFHLYTHAFFKALLFLGAGAVIYACHHEQNIWKMGGLLKKMPITAVTFAVGTAALIAIPFTSGFWSKEHILHDAWEATNVPGHLAIFGIGVFVAFLTPFYMCRLFIVAFLGKGKSKDADHAHEVSPVMFVPLVILAVVSLISVYFNVPEFLRSTGHTVHPLRDLDITSVTALASLLALILGVGLASVFYLGRNKDPFNVGLLRNKFYIDEIYQKIVDVGQDGTAKVLDFVDRYIVDPVVAKAPALTAFSFGSLLRYFQVGNLQSYALYFGIAVFLLVLFLIF